MDKASLSSSGKVCLLIPRYRTSSQALFPNRWWEHLISKSSCGYRHDITGNGLFSEDQVYSSWLHNFKFSFHNVLHRQTLRPSRQRNWGPSETDHMTINASNIGNIISGLVITTHSSSPFLSMVPHSHHLRVFTLLQDDTVMEKMKTVHMTC